MKLARTVRLGLGAVATILCAGVALADIAAFNAAVKSGNYKAAAAEAKTIWAGWDRSDRDTAVVAREFGFASYVAGDYAAARDFGQFLKQSGATLATPDDQPATSRLLLAAANFRLSSTDATRKDLFDAVIAREAAPGLDSMSMLGAEALYKADWQKGRWREASESGAAAYRLLSRGGETLAPRALEARTTGTAGDFLAQRDKDDYDNMADTHDAIIEAIDAAKDPKRRESLVMLGFTARAWTYAIEQFFSSIQQTGSSIPFRVNARELRSPQYGYFASDGSQSAGVACQLELENRYVFHYPQSAAFNGMVGAVITRFEVDATGRITDAETLAAVPARHFSEAVMEAVPKIRFKATRESPPNCTIARKNHVYTLMFTVG